MSPSSPLRLDFTAEATPALPQTGGAVSLSHPPSVGQPPSQTRTLPTIFGHDEDELPPTWSEDSSIFHTWAKCTRLQAIRRNRRITGNPGLRQHCLNCISIAGTHRRG